VGSLKSGTVILEDMKHKNSGVPNSTLCKKEACDINHYLSYCLVFVCFNVSNNQNVFLHGIQFFLQF
jgi:hypothetical protein